MNQKLKTLENLTEFLSSELRTAANDRNVNDKTYELLKQAVLDSIELKQKIALARAWNEQ